MNRKLWSGGILTFVSFFVTISQIYAVVSNTDVDPVKVIVTNTSDIVNGNTQTVADLISNPGPDGISFREAIYACNGTSGKKIISFDPSLKGDTITLSNVTNDVFRLLSGELVIDGDINKDGIPDITLDGHLGYTGIPSGIGICVLSNDNTITGLNLYDFNNAAIMFACPDASCGTKLFANNNIIKNTISCPRGTGITIGVFGIRPGEEAPLFSDITWNGIVINGNTISAKNNAIYICPGVSGGDRNKMLNVTISENHLSSEDPNFTTLDIIVADVNSHYFHLPGTTDYSDFNLFDNLIITKNFIEAKNSSGIHIVCANYGNENNILRNVTISENTITNIKIRGISLTVGDDNGNNDKPTNSNLISHVEISKNVINKVWQGILISGADPGSGIGANNNKAENITISQNQISDYTDAGISLLGGVSNWAVMSGNILDAITISDNNIYQTLNPGYAFGIKIQCAVSYNGSPLQNIIRDLRIVSNKISKNFTGLQILGGDGIGAKDNQIIISEIRENFLLDNNIPSDIQNNLNGATKNSCTPTIPSITNTVSNSHCGIGTVELAASASTGIINWYSDPEGGNSIGTGTSFITPSLISTTAYYVDATDNGCTTLSRTAVTATIMGTDLCQTMNEEISSSDKIKIYPNPTDGKLEVLVLEPVSSDYKIEVYNSLGSLYQTITMCKNENNAYVDLSKFSDGMYLIKIESKVGNYHFSVIKK